MIVFYSLRCDAILNSKRRSLRSTRRSKRIWMSVGAASGRLRNRVPSGMEATLWFRTPQDCRARPFARGRGAGFGWRGVRPNPPRRGGTPGHRAVPARHQAGAGEARRPGDARRPAIAVEMDMQESGEARCGAVERGLEGELDDGGAIAARAWLSAAVGAQEH